MTEKITKPDLYRREDGRIVLKHLDADQKPVETALQIACCFPWSLQDQWISLRDDKGKELILLEKLDDLDPATSVLIKEEMAFRTFLARITSIDAITDEMELFRWDVQTNSGERTFLTNRHDMPRNLPGGKVLIKDVGNDQYIIDNPGALDAKSRKLLWVYLD